MGDASIQKIRSRGQQCVEKRQNIIRKSKVAPTSKDPAQFLCYMRFPMKLPVLRMIGKILLQRIPFPSLYKNTIPAFTMMVVMVVVAVTMIVVMVVIAVIVVAVTLPS